MTDSARDMRRGGAEAPPRPAGTVASTQDAQRLQVDPAQAMPDIRTVLPWSDWDDALDLAQAQGKPIFCWAEPSWANSSQRFALVLEQDAALRRRVLDETIPAFVDPTTHPGVVARLRAEAVVSGSSPGPPLAVLSAPDGGVLVPYPSMRAEGHDGLPSLASLIAALTAELGRSDEPVRGRSAPNAAANPTVGFSVEIAIDTLLELADAQAGGFRELPKHAHPVTLWAGMDMLDLASGARATALETFLRTTLTAIVRGGVHDHVGGGFHRCSRDDRWIVPHFEKLATHNAQMAAVLARAARRWGDADFSRAARGAATFARSSLDAGAAGLAADTFFYTWTSAEFSAALDPELQQVLGFHYHVTPAKTRHVLYRALDPSEMQAYSHESPDDLESKIERGRFQLLMYRNSRRPLATIPTRDPRMTWETTEWLLRSALLGVDVDTESVIEHMSQAPRSDVETVRNSEGEPSDGMHAANALIQAYRVTEEPSFLDRATAVARRALASGVGLGTDGTGRHDSLPGMLDGCVSSSAGVWVTGLAGLAETTGEQAWASRASEVAEQLAASALENLPWSGRVCMGLAQLRG